MTSPETEPLDFAAIIHAYVAASSDPKVTECDIIRKAMVLASHAMTLLQARYNDQNCDKLKDTLDPVPSDDLPTESGL